MKWGQQKGGLMKARTVMVTIEMESTISLRDIKMKCKFMLSEPSMRVKQINATVQQPVKARK